jgi:hypothetical protein
MAVLIFLTAPLGFFAADFGYRMAGRKQVVLVGVLGAAVPLFGTLLLLSVLDMATYASPFYQPSLHASISMALFSQVSKAALPPRVLIAGITVFGAIRFGARALATAIESTSLGRRATWVVLIALIRPDRLVLVAVVLQRESQISVRIFGSRSHTCFCRNSGASKTQVGRGSGNTGWIDRTILYEVFE